MKVKCYVSCESYYFFIGKLHMQTMGFEPTISLPTTLVRGGSAILAKAHWHVSCESYYSMLLAEK